MTMTEPSVELTFEAPDDFDCQRDNASLHLAFGHGEHYCPGAMLARLEAKVAVERLLDRIQNIRLAADNTFAYEDTFLLRGLQSLNVEFDAR